MKLSLQMSQTTASAHQHNPVALLAELVELLQSSIHGEAGCLKSAISGVVLVKRKKKVPQSRGATASGFKVSGMGDAHSAGETTYSVRD